VILQLYSEPFVEELNILLVCVHMVCLVLREVVELMVVQGDSVVPRSQCEELCQLVAHRAR
jgi:hypothetical protein